MGEGVKGTTSSYKIVSPGDGIHSTVTIVDTVRFKVTKRVNLKSSPEKNNYNSLVTCVN